MTDLDKMALLPCPFCGGSPTECMDSADDPCRFIRCDNCDFDLMGGPVGIGWWPSLDAAAKAWNKRALLTAPPGYVLVPVELIDAFPEINPSNYDHDDACKLNAWACELVIAAAPEVK